MTIEPVVTPKKPWNSKTYWVNILAGIAIIAQMATGTDVLRPEIQTLILIVVNLILRKVTNQPLEW